MDERRKPGRGDLAGDLGDADRPAELVGRLTAHKHPADVGECPIDHEPRLLRPHDASAKRPGLFSLDVAGRHRSANSEHTETMQVAEVILDLLELRSGFKVDLRAAAI